LVEQDFLKLQVEKQHLVETVIKKDSIIDLAEQAKAHMEKEILELTKDKEAFSL
jgi:hypothetical protein